MHKTPEKIETTDNGLDDNNKALGMTALFSWSSWWERDRKKEIHPFNQNDKRCWCEFNENGIFLTHILFFMQRTLRFESIEASLHRPLLFVRLQDETYDRSSCWHQWLYVIDINRKWLEKWWDSTPWRKKVKHGWKKSIWFSIKPFSSSCIPSSKYSQRRFFFRETRKIIVCRPLIFFVASQSRLSLSIFSCDSNFITQSIHDILWGIMRLNPLHWCLL